MPTKEEKERRKQLHREIAKKEYDSFIESLPMDKSLMLELFDYLDSELGNEECNHDYTLTKRFLQLNDVKNEKIFEWFQENGGYCDCEILFNIEERFQ